MWKTPFLLLALLAAVSSTVADARANEMMTCRGGGMAVTPLSEGKSVYISFVPGGNVNRLRDGECAWANRPFKQEGRRIALQLSAARAQELIAMARGGGGHFTVRATPIGTSFIMAHSVVNVLSSASSSAAASETRDCTAYARSAVQQVREAAAVPCGFTGSRWSSNEGDHYRYCLANSGRRQQNLARETDQRTSALAQCKFRRHF